MARFFYGIITTFAALACTSQGSNIHSMDRIDGVCLVAPPEPISPEDMLPIQELGAGWVAVVPYAFSYGSGNPKINYDTSRQWWGERKEGVITTIQYAHDAGLKVMLKPHVWVRGEGWPGDFTLDTEEKWKQWEQSYTEYLQTIAQVADSMNVALLCIGTEYRQAVVQRPDFWPRLIRDIRQQYDGPLTYAANWDNIEQVKFWDELDYIGIDAYWPLCERETPTVETLTEGWRKPLAQIEAVQQRYDKPVLFTEYGYESRDYTAGGHWNAFGDDASDTDATEPAVNLEAQRLAYQVLYDTFWEQPWFAGGFLWKWFPNHADAGGPQHTSYTPQNKPATEVIRSVYQ